MKTLIILIQSFISATNWYVVIRNIQSGEMTLVTIFNLAVAIFILLLALEIILNED